MKVIISLLLMCLMYMPVTQAQEEGEGKEGPIRRILYFSYKPDTPSEEIKLVKTKFQDMVPLIEGMEAAVWMDSPDTDALYNHSLLLVFTNEDAVKTYEEHPNHQLAIEKWKAYGDGSKIMGHTYQEN